MTDSAPPFHEVQAGLRRSARHPAVPVRPCPTDICYHRGLFYLLTHAVAEGSAHGCLSVWDRRGGLLAKVTSRDGPFRRHPNGIAVFCPGS